MRIVIIGTGNTATVLGKLFIHSGHTVVQVFGRSSENATHLANVLHSTSTAEKSELNMDADLYLLAVSDKAISSITSWLRLPGKLVLHCAGSVDKEVLSLCTKNYGVLYPVQSLRKELDSIPRITFLVDGNTEDTGALIYDFANTLSRDVQFANDYQRMITHIAAIMVSNFTNHLYAVAEDLCKNENIRFGLLLPLITEVAVRINEHSPSMLQTGPAVRGDSNTILKHIALLEKFPEQQSIYRSLTNSIQNWHDKHV